MSHATRLQAHTARHPAGTFRIPQLDFNRIAAEAGTIVINGVLLLLLLVPLAPGVGPVEVEEEIIIIPATPRQPPPPIAVVVTKRSVPAPVPKIMERPIEVPPIVVPDPTPMDIAIDPVA
jgi:protein TonB